MHLLSIREVLKTIFQRRFETMIRVIQKRKAMTKQTRRRSRHLVRRSEKVLWPRKSSPQAASSVSSSATGEPMSATSTVPLSPQPRPLRYPSNPSSHNPYRALCPEFAFVHAKRRRFWDKKFSCPSIDGMSTRGIQRVTLCGR